jgi:hypothetical protein
MSSPPVTGSSFSRRERSVLRPIAFAVTLPVVENGSGLRRGRTLREAPAHAVSARIPRTQTDRSVTSLSLTASGASPAAASIRTSGTPTGGLPWASSYVTERLWRVAEILH